MTWRGIFSGALVLIALEAVLHSNESADRFGGMFTSVAAVVSAALSLEIPAIPDKREGTMTMGPPATRGT